MGQQIRLKKDVVPHRYINTGPEDNIPSQLTDSARKRKAEALIAIQDKRINDAIDAIEAGPSKKLDLLELSDMSLTSEYSEASVSEYGSHNFISPSSEYSDTELENSTLATTRRNTTVTLIENNSKFYLGLPKKNYILIKLLEQWAKMNYINILIVLKKIKLNDVYNRLADDFGMSVSNVSKIFSTSVPKLASILWHFIYFPDQYSVRKMLPIPFRLRYRNVFCIIDCLEVQIEKPSDPLQQSLTWSEYKKCNTVKFLISCTPNGFINFISKGYGGRATDNEVVLKSGFMENLPPNVALMADRGFKQIESILLQHNCKLIRPPSVCANEKLSKDEARTAKQIAALRIHVERVIRRIREFEFLHMHACINRNYFRLINSIIVISCALINLQEPIL